MRRFFSLGLRGIALGLVCCAAGGGSGCQRGARNAESARPERPAAAWFVRIGAQGGFTGGGSGYVIHADGRVTSWSQMTPGDSVAIRDEGRAPLQAIADLEAALRSPELTDLEHAETGNMTAFLEWHEAGRTRRWSWVERLRSGELPPALARAHAAALAAAKSAEPEDRR